MKCIAIPLAALLSLALSICVAVTAVRGPMTQGPVYSVAEVQARLMRSPAAWVGQIVRVRGIAVTSGCDTWPSPENMSCRGWVQGIVDADRAAVLPFSLATPNPPLEFLRRLPLVSQLVFPPPTLRWGALATYRVQLRAAAAGTCPSPPCYQALLLDAAP